MTTIEAASRLSEPDVARLHHLLKTQMSEAVAESLFAALTKGDATKPSEPSAGATEIVKSLPTSFVVTYEPRHGRAPEDAFITIKDESDRDSSGRPTIRRTATIPMRAWLPRESSLEFQMQNEVWRTGYGPVGEEVESRLDAFAKQAVRDADGFKYLSSNKCDASLILGALTMPSQKITEGWRPVSLTDKDAQAKWSVSDATKVGLGIVGWGGHTGGFLAPLTVSWNVAVGPEPSELPSELPSGPSIELPTSHAVM